MKKLILLLLAMLLLLPCLAQAETARERVRDLAAQAEATLEAMGLEPVETSLNPLTEWPLVIPADVMENELLPVLEGRLRGIVEDHYRPMTRDASQYASLGYLGPTGSSKTKTDSRFLTRYYVLKGEGLYASTEEEAALKRMYPSLAEKNLWLLKRSLRSKYTGLHSNVDADSKVLREVGEVEALYPPLETDVIWELREEDAHQELDLAQALANCGYTEEHYREDRMLVDATAIVERPYQSVCRFWLRGSQEDPCILMVFETEEAALEAHRRYAATPDDYVALLWDRHLLVLPMVLEPRVQADLMHRFLIAVQY